MASGSSTDHNARSLYVGNIDPSITDTALHSAFDSDDTKVVKVKLFKNRTVGATSEFGFIEFEDHAAAEKALQRSAGLKLADKELKVNWANSSPSHSNHSGSHAHNSHGNHTAPREHQAAGKVGANGLYNVFVGDLDASVDEAELKATFAGYASLEDVKVMQDLETGVSRGFGFVMFKEKQDAQNAIAEMQGRQVGARNLRLNWAHLNRNERSGEGSNGSASGGGSGHSQQGRGEGERSERGERGERTGREGRKPHASASAGPLDYNEVVAQSPASNVTVYVGNLAPDVTTAMLQELFAPHGEIAEVRDHTDASRSVNGETQHRGYGFILFKTHESAARAIVALNGRIVNGKSLKCSWGNEKRPVQNTTGALLPGFPYGSSPFPNGFASNHMYFYQYPHYQAALQTPPNGLAAPLPNAPLQPGAAPYNALAWAPWSPPQAAWPQNPQLLPMTFPAGLSAPSQTAPALGSLLPLNGVPSHSSAPGSQTSPVSTLNSGGPPGLSSNPSPFGPLQ
jgi:nucleolysin TIA-1/TIAR